jgi:hypothetical protein
MEPDDVLTDSFVRYAGSGRRRRRPEPIEYGCVCGTHDAREMWPECRELSGGDARHRRPRFDDPVPEGTVSLFEARVRRDVRRALERDGY